MLNLITFQISALLSRKTSVDLPLLAFPLSLSYFKFWREPITTPL